MNETHGPTRNRTRERERRGVKRCNIGLDDKMNIAYTVTKRLHRPISNMLREKNITPTKKERVFEKEK